MKKIEAIANYLGYEIQDWSNHPDWQYRNHPEAQVGDKRLALVDRRNGEVICIYDNKAGIRKFLQRWTKNTP